MATPKEAAKQLIEHISDEATWDEILYELYVKQKIEQGLKALTKAAPFPMRKRNSGY